MKQLVIVGARGFGREIADWCGQCVGFGSDFVVKGFLDDKKDALKDFLGYPPILSSLEDYSFASDDVFVVALGNPKWKRTYALKALAKGGVPYTLVHKTASVGKNTCVGKGCLIQAGVRLSVDCRIGDFVSILTSSVLGHDTTVGDYCHIGSFGFMGGGALLGECVEMHPRASILPHKTVGSESIIGAGSVCIRKVKPGVTVFGAPAREI